MVSLFATILANVGCLTMSTFTFRKRTFLASVATGYTSYIFAEVESSQGGTYKFGHYMLTIADCRRRIELEFLLGTARDRRQSLAKVDLLIEVLSRFRAALVAEAQLITEYEQAGRRSPRSKQGTQATRTV
jgi:hypothetical protein